MHKIFSTSSTSSSTSTSNIEEASLLLEHVYSGNVSAAQEIVSKNPKLMFTQTSSNKPEKTPLKLALYLLDARMCRMFYDVAKKNTSLFIPFKLAVCNQSESFNLEPLLTAYDTFSRVYRGTLESLNVVNVIDPSKKFMNNFALMRDISDELQTMRHIKYVVKNEIAMKKRLNQSPQMQELWLEIGKQQKLLPPHLLNKFCSATDNDNANSEDKTQPIIYLWDAETAQPLTPLKSLDELGNKYTLIKMVYATGPGRTKEESSMVAADLKDIHWKDEEGPNLIKAIIESFYDLQKQELEDFRAQFKPSSSLEKSFSRTGLSNQN